MRVAAIYDIHGNLPALEGVLDEIHEAAADRIRAIGVSAGGGVRCGERAEAPDGGGDAGGVFQSRVELTASSCKL